MNDPGDPDHPALAGCLSDADDGRDACMSDNHDATVPFSVLFRRVLSSPFAPWSKIIGGQFQPAAAFALWSIALGAIPAISDVILGFMAPDLDVNTVNG